MATLADLLIPALRMAGVTALPGTTPNSPQYGELIPAVNRMLSSWSCEGHRIYTSSIDEYDLVPSQKIYTIGPGGDLDNPRPIQVTEANYIFPGSPQIRIGIRIVDRNQWASICMQDIAGAPPWVLYYDNSIDASGRGRIYITGQAPTGYKLELYTWTAIATAFAATTDAVVLPPGYEEAIVDNLALTAARLYRNPITPDMRDAARRSLDTLIILNSKCPALSNETALYLDGPQTRNLLVGGGGGDVDWINPLTAPDGIISTFTFSSIPRWLNLNGLDQFEGRGFTRTGIKTIQFIDQLGQVIIPDVDATVKAAINTGTSSSSAVATSAMQEFTIAGTIDGTNGSDGNAVFTLSATPSFLQLFKNGSRQIPAVSYTLSGSTVTFLAPNIPISGDTLSAAGNV